MVIQKTKEEIMEINLIKLPKHVLKRFERVLKKQYYSPIASVYLDCPFDNFSAGKECRWCRKITGQELNDITCPCDMLEYELGSYPDAMEKCFDLLMTLFEHNGYEIWDIGVGLKNP